MRKRGEGRERMKGRNIEAQGRRERREREREIGRRKLIFIEFIM